MSIATEPQILTASGFFTSNAVAGTQNTDTLIAAPGANQRLRIYYVGIGFSLASLAAATLLLGVTIPLGIPLGVGSPYQPSFWIDLPEGIPITSSTAFQFIERASAASVSYRYSVGYVQEAG